MKKSTLKILLPLVALGLTGCGITSSPAASSAPEASSAPASSQESSQVVSSEESSEAPVVSSSEESSEAPVVSSSEESSSIPEPHVCEHVCDFCGGCTDPDCTDPECVDKCPGYPHTLYTDPDCSGIFGANANVVDGVASLLADTDFELPVLDPNNNYDISFDLDRTGVGESLFIHLTGLNQGDNLYFAVQPDGYTCLNVWKDGVWHYLYGFQNEYGGFSGINNVTWGSFHNYRILIVEGLIELQIDGSKCFATSLENFGGYVNTFETGRPWQTVKLTEGNLTRLFFGVNADEGVKMKNFVIKQAPVGKSTFTVGANQDGGTYPLRGDYNVADLAGMKDFKMEGVITMSGESINAGGANVQFNLRGFNGISVKPESGNNGLNVQLGFDYNEDGNFSFTKLYPCLFWNNDNAGNWGMKIADPWDYAGVTQLKVTFIAYQNTIQMFLNDAMVINETCETLGITRAPVTGLGSLVLVDGAQFVNMTMSAYTPE